MVLTFTLQSIYSGATYVAGPFDISGTTSGGITTLLGDNISKSSLLAGVTISNINDATTGGTIQSVDGTCSNSIEWSLNPTSTPTPVPPTSTPTATPPSDTPTPTPTMVPVCKEATVTMTYTSTTIQLTYCNGSPGSVPLGSGVSGYSLGCIQEGSASGGASFSYGSICS